MITLNHIFHCLRGELLHPECKSGDVTHVICLLFIFPPNICDKLVLIIDSLQSSLILVHFDHLINGFKNFLIVILSLLSKGNSQVEH